MITAKDLGAAISRAKPLFVRLQDLYEHLPETRCTCDDPGACCTFLPEMTALEALQWIKLMQEMPNPERTATLRKFVAFYLTNPARLTGCPFREDGACTLYPYRTFGCRSYGLWSQEMGKVRTENSRNGKKALRKMWKDFGVDIPAQVIEYEVDYCDKVQIHSGEPLGDDPIMELLTRVYDLGKPLGDLQARFEEEYHSDFSFLLTSMALGMRKGMLIKFAVIKEMVQQGTQTRLQEILDKISPKVLLFP